MLLPRLAGRHLAAGNLANLAGILSIAALTLGMAWSALITSPLSQNMLMWMLRHGEATHVTALMLLVPPVAAVLAYELFHETLSWLQWAGFALALAGVVLARRASPATAS